MKHFLITRFNLIYKRTKIKKYEPSVIERSKILSVDPRWLEFRLKLFETFCLPSVRGQTNQDFSWLLLCNADTPPEFKRRMLSYENENTECVFTHDSDVEVIVPEIKRRLTGKEKFVINTQVDSDDALSKEFMEVVRNEYQGRREFIDIFRGYALCNDTAYGRSSEHSAFRSFVEPIDNIISVYAVIHVDSKNVAPLRSIDVNEARWMQLIHFENLTNKLAKKSQDKGFPWKKVAPMFSCTGEEYQVLKDLEGLIR